MSYLKIKWVKSAIGRTQDRGYHTEPWFRKLQQERVMKNTPEIRGMVKKVIHLLEIVEDVK